MPKHFAKLDENNKVVALHIVHDDVAPTEQAGMDFLNTIHKTNAIWKQNFKDGSQRKQAAAVGYTYDESRDAFIGPQPYPSWIFNESTCIWDPPVSMPDGIKTWKWNEETVSWIEYLMEEVN
jgi:hypothetical protein|tara:strand:- start:3004 stop:3369 length:366 start_codon:yes stop_codon:yes gene_type:complete